MLHSRLKHGRFGVLLAGILSVVPLSASVTGSDAAHGPGLRGRLVVGYQGWFGCPGDFGSNRVWQHWFLNGVQPQHFTVDLLPSLTGFETSDLCDTGLVRPDGSKLYLYSAQNPHVVATHFRWMREHGIDGAAVQRFVAAIVDPEKRRRSDKMLRNVMAAAAAEQRVFYLTYDVSQADPATVIDTIRSDWRHLVDDLGLTASPGYLFDDGKPVLELWGFGFIDHPGSPLEVAALIRELKTGRNGSGAVRVVGGVPTSWRTLAGDSQSDPAWAATYRGFNVISPWSVGRFHDAAGADAFRNKQLEPDLAETRRLGIGYMPVIFPGFSWSNMQRNRGQQARAILNQIPRRCGTFLWRQVYNVLGSGADMMYAAMFDEFDEGTALLPTITRPDDVPLGAVVVTHDDDGCHLRDDWYLQITGKAAQLLRTGAAPPPDLSTLLTPTTETPEGTRR